MHIFLINCSRTKSWGETLFVQTNQRKGDFYKTAETTKTHTYYEVKIGTREEKKGSRRNFFEEKYRNSCVNKIVKQKIRQKETKAPSTKTAEASLNF